MLPGMGAMLPGRRLDTPGVLDGVPMHLWPQEFHPVQDNESSLQPGPAAERLDLKLQATARK